MRIFICICLTVLLAGCKGHSQKTKDTLPTYQVDLDKEEEVSLYDIFSKVDVIPLNTPDSIVCSGFHSRVYKDRLFFFDIRQRIVLCFDLDGNYRYKIDAKGRGPKEYISLDDIQIDPYNERLLLLDCHSGVLQYDLDGHFIKKIKFPVVTNAAHMVNKNTILYISVFPDSKKNILNFFSLKDGRITESDYIEHPIFMVNDNVTFYNNNSYYCISKLPIVYNISEGKLTPVYQWDFGKYNYDYNDLPIPECKTSDAAANKQGEWIYRNCPFTLNCVMENSIYICADIYLFAKRSLSDPRSPHYYIFWNKKNKDYRVAYKFKEGKLFRSRQNFKEDAVYDVVERSQIKDFVDINSLTPENRKIVEELPEDCNPVILKYCFK